MKPSLRIGPVSSSALGALLMSGVVTLIGCGSASPPPEQEVTGLHFTTATGLAANPPPNVDVTLTDPVPTRAIYAATLALPDYPPGAYSCPNDSGVRYTILFSVSGDGDVTAVISPTGCDEVTISGTTMRRALGSGYYETLATNLGVPLTSIYPYAPSP
jgi:hypothetical protein